jgi:hypothetical protein
MPFRRLLLVLLLLAACAEGRPEPPAILQAAARLPGPAHEAIEVVVYDIPPGTQVEQVWLLGPAGERLSGDPVARSSGESGPGLVTGPTIGVGVTGGSSSGISPSVGIGWGVFGGGPSRQSRQITYLIALPPELAYDEAPRAWRIAVHYRDATGAVQVRDIPGPYPE